MSDLVKNFLVKHLRDTGSTVAHTINCVFFKVEVFFFFCLLNEKFSINQMNNNEVAVLPVKAEFTHKSNSQRANVLFVISFSPNLIAGLKH